MFVDMDIITSINDYEHFYVYFLLSRDLDNMNKIRTKQ